MPRNVIAATLLFFFIAFRADAEEAISVVDPQAPNDGESVVIVTLELDPNGAFIGDTFYEAVDLCADKGLPTEVEGPCVTTPYRTCAPPNPLPLGNNSILRAGVVDFQPFRPDVQFQVTVEPGGDGSNDPPGILDNIKFVVRCLDIFSEGIDNVTATKVAKSAHRTVFVTSETYTGNLGGIVGADEKCNTLAQAAGLYGTYRAWISDSSYTDSFRLRRSTLPYVRTDGVTVADNFNDLIDCSNPTCLKAPINVDEKGNSPGLPLSAWTFVTPIGGAANESRPLDFYQSCRNWTSSESERNSYSGQPQYGLLGNLTHRDAEWTYKRAFRQTCDLQAHLYCFQQ